MRVEFLVNKSVMKTSAVFLIFVFLFLGQFPRRAAAAVKGGKTMIVTSTAFREGEMIPEVYSCDGKNISPRLDWTDVPKGTKTFALIVDDPDAPRGTWVHWVLFNIPADAKGLGEHIPPRSTLTNGARQGVNDSHQLGYDGPCPPSGIHRYYFKLYALDTALTLESGATKAQLLKAMEGHILGHGELMGKYKR